MVDDTVEGFRGWNSAFVGYNDVVAVPLLNLWIRPDLKFFETHVLFRIYLKGSIVMKP